MVNYLTKRIYLLVAILAAAVPYSVTNAQTGNYAPSDTHIWYMGIEGGMPFGLSTFSSFGHDKTHLGWSAGLYGGYRFNSIFSAELSAKYGEMNLTAQDCCADRQYWLGRDGIHYNASVLGQESWQYANLASRVKMGQYGARVNINLLGLFHKTANSRWQLALSPHIYAVSTQADIRTLADNANVMKGSTNWHLGYGADVQIGYRLSSCLNIGVYSGLTLLTGERIDGIPEYLHKNNMVWESGIRLGINLSKKRKATTKETPAATQTYSPQPAPVEKPVEKPTVAKAETTVEAPAKVVFPVIYFAFNSTDIKDSEQPKLNKILSILQQKANLQVTVTGWCDAQGSDAVNKRISTQRAQAVKTWLVQRGIDASRITTKGNGSDNTKQATDARRVETTDNNNE